MSSRPPTKDPALADHLAWLGYVQPEGLVVSAPALVDAQAIIDRAQLGELQRRFSEQVTSLHLTDSDTGETAPGIENLQKFATEFLGWPYQFLVGVDPSCPLPDSLCVSLPEFQETLRPSFAVLRNNASASRPSTPATSQSPPVTPSQSPFLLLAQSHPATVDLDKPAAATDRNWHASPSKKFERLLRETGVPIGLLTNGRQLRLIYAPPKENSGALTFSVGAMTEVSGRLILGAFQLLFGSWTLFNAPTDARLPALLQRSRDYQATVSEILAEQVLHALYELLRGFEAADERAQGKLLRELAATKPAEIYGGFVTVLLRLVFTLFAEDRGLLPSSGLYARNYSVRGLFERLRASNERYPDTMDHRFGAWAQLLALFRAIHGGCRHAELLMPARHGYLFDPDRYPFLEGRRARRDSGTVRPCDLATPESQSPRVSMSQCLPLLSDGTIYRILDKLSVLEGERISYRALGVEEIGSVYQTIMGFGVEVAAGTAIALKGKRKKGGAPAAPVINLEALLAVPAKDRAKWLKEKADTELAGEADQQLRSAAAIDDLLVALDKRIDRNATPGPVAKGGLVLQPTDERRRSGTEYTPRSFTEPIVRKTLEPILKRLTVGLCDRETVRPESPAVPSQSPPMSGDRGNGTRAAPESQSLTVSKSQSPPRPPLPGAILSLRICDLAIGSGAFQVETCRQLGDELVRAWRTHGGRPQVPADEPEELFAMRLVAQHCLYGVDRNPMAVDLAKLSLWLATLARDHPFTFLDHAIRCGDSLVGLTRRQIEDFTWGPTTGQRLLFGDEVRKRTAAALRERQNLLGMGDDYGTPQLKREKLEKADELLDLVRFIGDAVITAYFSADKDKAREQKRVELAERIGTYLRTGDLRLRPTAEVTTLRSGLCDRGTVGPCDRGTLRQGDGVTGRQGQAPMVAKSHSPPVAQSQSHPVLPFHWEIEFPEVFERENPGFDGFVGNPPFAGKNTLLNGNREGFLPWLKSLHPGSHGNADIVAHFFRRAFNLLHSDGCFGLIATKTIRQGDTRETGLKWIRGNGGTIYSARRRYKWPGQAAVIVSVLHVCKGDWPGMCDLDGRHVSQITSYLFHSGGDETPTSLRANESKSFIGNFVLGMGFSFDDSGMNESANLLSDRDKLLALNPRNGERIFPYINGGETNDYPDHAHRRYIINFEDWPHRREDCGFSWARATDSQRADCLKQGVVPLDYPEAVAADYPDLLRAVEQRVLPERLAQDAEGGRQKWWLYRRSRPGLYAAVRNLGRVLVRPLTSTNFPTFTFLPSGMVYDQTLIVFAFQTNSSLAMLCSRCHEEWALFFGASMKDDPRYNVDDCFKPFPFPAGWEGEDGGTVRPEDFATAQPGAASQSHPVAQSQSPSVMQMLEEAGRTYDEFRAALMVDLWLGLTETYNLFHSPDDEALARLNALYAKRMANSEWRIAAKVPPNHSPFATRHSPSLALDGIRKLRELHAALDAAVLTAYGWLAEDGETLRRGDGETGPPLSLRCEFILDYEEDDGETGGPGDLATGPSSPSLKVAKSQSRRRKPWRYRWPDDIRDEILARLLKLNAERAKEEQLAGTVAGAAAMAKAKRREGSKAKSNHGLVPVQGELLAPPQPDLFG